MKNTTTYNTLRTGQDMLLPLWRTALAAALCAAAFCQPGLAQVPPASVLRIDVANNVLYQEDTSDVSKFATNPNVAADSHGAKNFNRAVGVADIVAVNGQPVTGTHIRSAINVFSARPPSPARQSPTPCGLRWLCSLSKS